MDRRRYYKIGFIKFKGFTSDIAGIDEGGEDINGYSG
jgi:hypothetical protein